MRLQILRQKKLIILIVAAILFISFGYLYLQYKNGNQILPGNSSIQEQQQSLINKIGKLILLPENETPQIATVSDKTKLADQPFFANAENGDKVLIYSVAQKAIIYRPSINKIINVAPINTITNTQPPVQASSSASPSVVSPTTSKSLVTPILTPTPTKAQ